MGDPCRGDYECVSCGLSDRASDTINKKLKPTFVALSNLMLGKGSHICTSCVAIMEDRDMRFKPVFFTQPAEKRIPDRKDILQILKNPPDQFVLSVPYSMKKHHWLFAGLSSSNLALIGTDNRTIEIDYLKNDVKLVIETIETLISMSVPRNEIICGKYSTFTRYTVPDIQQYDEIIGTMRHCGAVELFVNYTPAPEQKIKLERKDVMISDIEKKSAEILMDIAYHSTFRSNLGQQFWGGFFESRINRLKNLELHEFISSLMGAVGTSYINTKLLTVLSEDEEYKIMDSIRKKTSFLVALAYTYNKEIHNK